MSKLEWRTCSVCGHMYEGERGECPKCSDAHKKVKRSSIGGNTGNRKRKPTLDMQEGNSEENF